MDPAIATLYVAGISSATSLAGIGLTWFLTTRQNKKIDETHHMVTVNGGKSKNPTVLDYLTDLKSDVGKLDSRVSKIERKLEE